MEDALDIEKPESLDAYLRATGRIGLKEKLSIRVLAGGVSNRTVWVKRESGEAWVIKQALGKLRVKVDWFSDPARIHREALGLGWLGKIGASTPALVFEDESHHLLAMEAVAEPHENWKVRLLRGELELEYVRQFGRLLGMIHRKGWEQRDVTSKTFGDRSFFESLRIEPYYLYTAQQEPRAAEFLRMLVDDTRGRRDTVVHGDYSPKNILVWERKIVLLDHEVIHFGEPAFDLGFALTHFLSKAHHVKAKRAEFANAAIAFWQAYREELGPTPWGKDLEARAIRQTLGCLLARVAGRSQLEYLDDRKRAAQRKAVVGLMAEVPAGVTKLSEAFTGRL
jgi:5-methylthioribose kinase